MNILYIEHYAGSPDLGMEYRPYYLACEWVRLGHRVRIIAASFSHLRTRNPVFNNSLFLELKDGIEYLWIKTPSYSKNGIRRIINMLFFIIGLFLGQTEIAKNFSPDVVIASSTYPLDNYFAGMIAKRYHAKYVYEVHDLWPLSPMELGGYSRWNLYIMIMQAAENYGYKHCNKVVSLLPCAESYMREHGLPIRKFVYIPNGINPIQWSMKGEKLPILHRSVIDTAKRNGSIVVCYAGSHGLANALDSFLDAAKLLEDMNVIFLLVGSGPEKARLEHRIKAENIKNVISLPSVCKAVIPDLLTEMDILFIGLQRQPLFRFGISPNKLLDYMMAGKPIIQAIEAGNDLTSEARCGISVKPEDPTAIADAVRRLMNMSESERRILGENGRLYVLRHHDYRILARKFLDVIEGE